MGGSLSVSQDFTLGGTFFSAGGLLIDDDVTITQTLFVDFIRKEANQVIAFSDDVLFNQDLTVGGGNIFSTGDFTINPDQDGTVEGSVM